jgi:hypothetical protein
LSQFLPGDVNASRAKTASNLWARTLFSLFDYFFIMTIFCPSSKLSSPPTRLSAGLIHHDMTVFILLPGFAKIAPWCLARRDSLLTKVPGLVTGVTAPPTLSAHTRNRYV